MKEVCNHKILLSSYDGVNYVTLEKNELKFIHEDFEEEERDCEDYIKINYCPNCGEKLGE